MLADVCSHFYGLSRDIRQLQKPRASAKFLQKGVETGRKDALNRLKRCSHGNRPLTGAAADNPRQAAISMAGKGWHQRLCLPHNLIQDHLRKMAADDDRLRIEAGLNQG